MQQKIIIAFIALFFILSSAYLFNISEKKQDLGLNKNWWAAYFENPTDNNSLNFTIENYSNNKDFSWEVISKNNKTIGSGKETIASGSVRKINYRADVQENDLTTIRITTDKQEIKEIYKNIN